MIKHRYIPSQYADSSVYETSYRWQSTSDNGAEFYGAITLATIAGAVFGIVTGQPFVGLFAGMGSGLVIGLGLTAGRQILDRVRGR